MKFIYFVAYLVLLKVNNNLADENPKFSSTTKTTLGSFDANFAWKITNLDLYDFGSRYKEKPLISPDLTVEDNKQNNKTYSCKITISPEYQYKRIHYNDYDEFDNYEIVKYKIAAEFSPAVIKTEYQFGINGTMFDGSVIEKSQLKPEDTVEIVVKASF